MAKQIITANGTVVNLENKYLDDDFCEEAKEYFCKKNNWNYNNLNTYFTARAVEEYIRDNNLQPIYEE